MTFKTFFFSLLFLICACSGGKTVQVYELQKDLYYDMNGGDGVGVVSDIEIKTAKTLPKGTKISVTTQMVDSLISGKVSQIDVVILDGAYKGNEIYIDSIKNTNDSLKLITR
ncbi:MAG: hypothetical protein NE327_08730 [Lentisphaeraceae bacterium]|nr:hypothetical protein [Lentisphaeraceae bacterium]